MKWANFLHFYQPVSQQKDILEAVVNQCYRPIFKGLLNEPAARLTINVSGGLFEALEKCGFLDVLESLRQLYRTGRVEFTSTSCYHAFLPLLPESETRRQITLNNDKVEYYLQERFRPKGFFSPEMAYNPKVLNVAIEMGFEYILLDEISRSGYGSESEDAQTSEIYQIKGTSLKVFFRQRNPSNIIMSGIERHSGHLLELLRDYSKFTYLVTAMDGETFGHHRPGLEKPFLEVFKDHDIQFCKIDDLLISNLPIVDVGLVDSTWASSQDDFSKGIQFISWNDPENILHKWQWELVNLMLGLMDKVDVRDASFGKVRSLADRAVASDQFFWASAKPWWSVEMIESGAYACLIAIENIPGLLESDLSKAQTLYRNIISTAFEWQRTGRIREMSVERHQVLRIPFKTRTLEVGGEETAVYQAFVDMMREEERQAVERGEYEKAILWRDAVYKIETKNDIYDAINAIDLLRIAISNEKVEKVIDEYKSTYKKIRGGQPEQRSN